MAEDGYILSKHRIEPEPAFSKHDAGSGFFVALLVRIKGMVTEVKKAMQCSPEFGDNTNLNQMGILYRAEMFLACYSWLYEVLEFCFDGELCFVEEELDRAYIRWLSILKKLLSTDGFDKLAPLPEILPTSLHHAIQDMALIWEDIKPDFLSYKGDILCFVDEVEHTNEQSIDMAGVALLLDEPVETVAERFKVNEMRLSVALRLNLNKQHKDAVEYMDMLKQEINMQQNIEQIESKPLGVGQHKENIRDSDFPKQSQQFTTGKAGRPKGTGWCRSHEELLRQISSYAQSTDRPTKAGAAQYCSISQDALENAYKNYGYKSWHEVVEAAKK